LIIVGASDDGNANGNAAGAVFLFTKMPVSSVASWTQIAQLLAADGSAADNFGSSVSISKDASAIVIGAYQDDLSVAIANSGAAYLFQTTNSATTTATVEWTQVGKFVAMDGATHDQLGCSISIENNIVAVGAMGFNTGSMYILDTGFSFSTPTTTPTIQPAEATSEPTLGHKLNQSNPPTTMAPTTSEPPHGHTFNQSNPSTTIPPTIGQSNSEPETSKSAAVLTPGAIVGMSIVVGVVVVVIVALRAFISYHLKQGAGEQQQAMNAGNTIPPQTHFTGAAAVSVSGTPMIADVILMPPPQAVPDRTMEVGAFLDPATTAAAVASANMTHDVKKNPNYKDQVRSVAPQAPSTRMILSVPLQKKQQHQDHNHCKEEGKQEGQVPPRQQQLHQDPPESIDGQHWPKMPRDKDQVSL
jgi:hypothetical protein